MSNVPDTTTLLNSSDPDATNLFFERARGRLRAIAHTVMGRTADPQLQTDDLIQSALIKVLPARESRVWEKSQEFFGLVANAMRQVLIDRFRVITRRPSQSMGDMAEELADPRDLGVEVGVMIKEMTELLQQRLLQFEGKDKPAARVMRLHLFGQDGESPMDIKDVAKMENLKLSTAYHARDRAREFLDGEMRRFGTEP